MMWLFTIFYAATFAIGVESENSDINRYVDEVEYLSKIGIDFQGALQYFYSSGEIDISRTILAVLVSLFTSNGYHLIIVFGIIYGYFFSRNMWYILDRLEGKIKFFTRLLLFCLFLTVPIWFLNGFRFWTATHMFIFGLLPFLLEGKKKSLIWCFITPFMMHFGFLFALLPLSLYLLLGNKLKYYFIFFILSLFISNINISQFNNILKKYAPEIITERTESYRSEDKVEEYRNKEGSGSNTVWYARYYSKVYGWVTTAFLVALFLSYRKKLMFFDKGYLRLLSFIFLFFGFANLLSTIPSGGRFLNLAYLLSISALVLIMQNFPPRKNLIKLSKLATPFLIFFIIVALRLSWYSLSWMTIIGNPITSIFTFGENTALNDIIKGL